MDDRLRCIRQYFWARLRQSGEKFSECSLFCLDHLFALWLKTISELSMTLDLMGCLIIILISNTSVAASPGTTPIKHTSVVGNHQGSNLCVVTRLASCTQRYLNTSENANFTHPIVMPASSLPVI